MTAAAAAGGSAAILLGALQDSTQEGRAAAAAQLAQHVENLADHPFADDVTAFLAELHRGLSLMLTASGAHERAGAVAAIDALMEVETEENAARLPRFAGYLRTVLQHAGNDAETLEAACAALGHLARAHRRLRRRRRSGRSTRCAKPWPAPARAASARTSCGCCRRPLAPRAALGADGAVRARRRDAAAAVAPLCAPGAPLRAVAAARYAPELGAGQARRPQWVRAARQRATPSAARARRRRGTVRCSLCSRCCRTRRRARSCTPPSTSRRRAAPAAAEVDDLLLAALALLPALAAALPASSPPSVA